MPTTQTGTNNQATLRRIVETITSGRRFVISSHARPDGDSIGSQMAMSFALQTLGKEVVVVNKDLAPGPLRAFPGVPTIQISNRVDEEFDAAVVMECGDLGRTGVAGLDRFFIINIDHHPDNTGYGQINWFDPTAAACGEMVYTLIRELGVPLTLEIATHIYLAILTDTGSFHYSAVTSRTFDICSDCETGVTSDEAVDRVVDIDRLDPRFAPVGPGSRIRITDLLGRSRLYRHKMHNGATRLAEGIVVAYKCDLLVAIVDGDMTDPDKRKMAHRFLESNTVQVWVNKQLEGR